MKHELMTITPEMAIDWLDSNTRNRPLNKRRVTNLANAILRGEWEPNGDAIRFSVSGVLLDGQHRLAAVAESDTEIDSLVVSGLPDSVFDIIDTGKSRGAGDILSMRGEKNYNAVASVVRLYYMWDKTGDPFHGSPDKKPTIREIEKTLDENPGLRRAAHTAIASKWIKRYLTPRLAGFCLYVFEQSAYSDKLESFYNVLDTGASSTPKDAAILLREMMMEDKAAGNKRKMSDRYKCALVFKAFKKHAKGEQSKFLRVRTEGDRKEDDLYSLPMAEK